MKLLFVADGRSPTSRSWIAYWIQHGHEVHLASTFHCDSLPGLASLEVAPVAFSGRAGRIASRQPQRDSRLLHLRAQLRHWLGPLTLPRAAQRLRSIAERLQPDLVHALRIPYEGMLAANANLRAPLVVSVWGNDFTLHAPSTPLMRHHTQRAMSVTDALHADCNRDIRLAREWGLDSAKPTFVAPGNGGIHTDLFFPPARLSDEPVIFNPRGFRAYVRNDTFFQSIPLVLKEIPNAKFVCASMDGQPEALNWIRKLGIETSIELLAPRPHEKMADVYRRAMILVSPSTHDGTPNTLLEGMACGCFPILGDLESLREWIRDGENGLLIDAGSPSALANAIIKAIKNKDLRAKAAGLNQKRIAERAEYARNMQRAGEFYQEVIAQRT
ncbi:MAG: D-inositol-3-phosphate glycosyltransferase [Anaerolineales bacterium]|nr:D-inositol-3-phosphate glycosyltransferase [Anaerolineales bacterium]